MPQLDGDVFIPRDGIPRRHARRPRPGKGFRRLGRRHRRAACGSRIIRILGRAHPTVVGLFRYGPQQNVVLPYDVRIQHEVVIPRGKELTPGLWKKLGLQRRGLKRSIRMRRIPAAG